MSKAIQGAAMLAGAVGMGALAFMDPALIASPLFDKVWEGLVVGGIAMEAGALAQALSGTGGMGDTIRRPAAFRPVIYGERRIRPVMVYVSTTGSKHDQYNAILVLAAHEIDSITGVYLDGRKVYFQGSGTGWAVRNGVGFGGIADGGDHVGPGGVHYNFGGTGHSGVYFEARYGDQTSPNGTNSPGNATWTGTPTSVIGGLTANDPAWDTDGAGNYPWLGGLAYVYMKLEYNTDLFPSGPAAADVQFTVRGKNDIFDPRTNTRGYTANSALVVADMLQDTKFGLGDVGSVNVDQLIAAANVCDEQVALAHYTGGTGTESRYCCHWSYDSSISPGDAISNALTSCAGRISRVSGEWFIFPAYWQGPSFSFDQSVLTGDVEWTPYRSLRDLVNRLEGTYIAANVPYNDAGNLYDSNGWFEGTILNNWPFGFEPTNFPPFALDTLHGYASDSLLESDSGVEGPWDSGTTYDTGEVITYGSGSVIYKSRADGNLNNEPDTHSVPYAESAAAYDSGTTYTLGAVATDGGQVYTSLQAANTGNQPSTSPTYWQLGAVPAAYDATVIYGAGDAVTGIGGVYISIVGSNLNNEPDISPAAWQLFQCWALWENALPLELDLNCVLSVAQAQRLAKIALMRNRQQGSGTLPMHLSAYGMMPLDVLTMDFDAMGWAGKVLEVTRTRFYLEKQEDAQAIRYEAQVQEADPSVYEWDPAAEELSVYDVPAGGLASRPTPLVGTYTNYPALALTQPTSTSIAVAAVAVTFGGQTVNYAARTLTISAPGGATWYYVTIADPTQQGESGTPTLTATASTSDALAGVQGNTYLGAILALPAGSAVSALGGGWPAQQTVQVI